MIPPIRQMQLPKRQNYYSFSSCTSGHILENYQGTFEHFVKILLLSCGDLPLALSSVFLSKYHVESITLTDVSPTVLARNVFFLKIINNEDFDPSNMEDLQYLWNIWYNMEWPSKTLQRFLKDVAEIIEGRLPINIKIPEAADFEILKTIWSSWKTIASDLNFIFREKIKQERYESIIRHINSILSSNIKMPEKNAKPALSEVWEWLLAQTNEHADLSHLPEYHQKAIFKDMRVYFETGNSTLNSNEIKVCINPTMLDPKTNTWSLMPCVSPFESYLVKQLTVCGDFLASCHRFLGGQISGYLPHLKETEMYFHLGESLDLCYRNNLWVNKFDVVDCTNTPDELGLANLLNAASLTLASDPNSILLTRCTRWTNAVKSCTSAKDFVEESLCAPIPMLPSLYGLRLINPVLLGSQEPLVGNRRPFLRLLWKKSPSYINVWSCLAPTLEQFFEQLQQKCFVGAEGKLEDTFTPMTYAFLAASLTSRMSLNDIDYQILMEPKLPPPCELAWRTLRAWLNGAKIYEMSLNLNLMNSEATRLRLVLASYAQSRVHYVDNIQLSREDEKTVKVKFLLLEDHQLDLEETVVYLAHGPSIPVTPPISLNFASFLACCPAPPFGPRCTSLLPYVCREFEEFYQVELPGIDQEELILSTDRKHPSEAGHKITLKTNEKMEVLTFPWPFNATEIHSSSGPESNTAQLILTKYIHEPHPDEWAKGKHWTIKTLKEWSSQCLIKDLNYHLSAQFDFIDLKRQMLDAVEPTGPSSGLRGVREIVRTLFQSTVLDGNSLYVIRSKFDPKLKNLWFLRVHTPVRIHPLGGPLLLMTANDHRLAQRLVDRGILDQGKATDDFKRIFVDGAPSSGVCPIFVQSDEEESLLRYMFRFNSTKIKSEEWPIEQLPVGEDSPWLATFITPSYIDQAGTDAEMEDLVATTKNITTKTDKKLEESSEETIEICSKCQTKNTSLKRCSRCKSVKYCSVECQRSDWANHKSSCV